MAKVKLKRFAELETFDHVIQPNLHEVLSKDHHLKGKWASDFFGNENPIVLELGCGKGEYTVNLARKDQKRNYLGIDIKGARIWQGAKIAHEEGLKNVGFLRTKIDLIASFFARDEISEIWITFPDPQLKERRSKKRLTSSRFLSRYRNFIVEGGIINLKTDSRELYDYTSLVIEENKLKVLKASADIYNSDLISEELLIKTFYENQYLEKGKKITYLQFLINSKAELVEPIIEDELPENN